MATSIAVPANVIIIGNSTKSFLAHSDRGLTGKFSSSPCCKKRPQSETCRQSLLTNLLRGKGITGGRDEIVRALNLSKPCDENVRISSAISYGPLQVLVTGSFRDLVTGIWYNAVIPIKV